LTESIGKEKATGKKAKKKESKVNFTTPSHHSLIPENQADPTS